MYFDFFFEKFLAKLDLFNINLKDLLLDFIVVILLFLSPTNSILS
jgi:hypothetical protein